jgi:hypothetical protein
MKPSIIGWLLIIINILLLVILLFFRDKFLFFLLGYDFDLMKGTSVESFKAYSVIQRLRIALVVCTLISGVCCFIFCRNINNHSNGWYYSVGKVVGIINSILAAVILIMIMILPKRIF